MVQKCESYLKEFFSEGKETQRENPSKNPSSS